jgi:hypothetical protein
MCITVHGGSLSTTERAENPKTQKKRPLLNYSPADMMRYVK